MPWRGQCTAFAWCVVLAIASVNSGLGAADTARSPHGGDIATDDPEDFIMSFDLDGDKKLSKDEFADMMITMRQQSLDVAEDDDDTDKEDAEEFALGIVAAFETHDVNVDGKMDFDEIVAMLLSKIQDEAPACKAPVTEHSNGRDEQPREASGMSEDTKDDYSDIPPEFFDKKPPVVPDLVWGDEDEAEDFGDRNPVEFAMGYDKNGDGVLSMGEFLLMMEDGGDSDDELIAYFKSGDHDQDGKLNVPELTTLFFDPSFGENSARNNILDPRRLFDIVKNGDLRELEEALGVVYSADGGAQDQECTPLHMALHFFDVWNHNRHLEPTQGRNFTTAALMLIEHGADLRAECEGRSALHYAVQHRSHAVVSAILKEMRSRIDHGALKSQVLDVPSAPSDYAPGGGTPLHAACYLHGHAIGVSKILVAHPGAGRRVVDEASRLGVQRRDIFVGGVEGALHSSFDAWKLSLPADILQSDGTSYKRQALTRALSRWSSGLVGQLIEAGLDVNARDLLGDTPLHVAALSGDALSCQQLLAAGADPTLKGAQGLTAADRAAMGGHKEVADLLYALLVEAKERAAADLEAMAGFRPVIEDGQRTASELRGTTDRSERARARLCEGIAGGASGGWKQGCRAELEVDYCDIASVRADADDLKEVLAKHRRLQRPLLIKGAIKATDAESMRVWSKEGMRAYGERSGRRWKVFRQQNGTKESLSMPMSDFIDAMERHDPEQNPSPDWLVEYGLQDGDELVESHNGIVKRYFADLYEQGLGLSNYQFMVAPASTGASPHFHFTSARLMVHGRARWFLWPVAQAFYSARDIHDWYVTDYPRLAEAERPLECVQEAGDLIFVPPLWGHGVLYLADTAGMASLFRA